MKRILKKDNPDKDTSKAEGRYKATFLKESRKKREKAKSVAMRESTAIRIASYLGVLGKQISMLDFMDNVIEDHIHKHAHIMQIIAKKNIDSLQ